MGFLVVGFGRLGYRAFGLLRRLGEPVVVIERDTQNQFLEDVRRDGSPVVIGDARDESMLEQAHIATARSVILATNDDLANLEIALDARRLHPGIRVVVRMFDQNMADKIRTSFNIHIAMSQAEMSAPAFATVAIDPSIVNSFMIDDQLVIMQRWVVNEKGPLCGKTVGDVLTKYGFGVVKQKSTEDKVSLFPSSDTLLEAGDRLVVQGPFQALAKLRRRSTSLQETPAPEPLDVAPGF